MSVTVRRVPFADDLLLRIADDVLQAAPRAAAADLGDALVLLPSARACKTLGRLLLERSGHQGLLLPRILTADQWAAEAALGLGLAAPELPADRVRALILAREMLALPWLAERPENAPGLAAEFLEFFDEVRRHRRDGLLLRARNLEPVLEKAQPQEAEIVAADLERAREVWRLYRARVARDQVDVAVQTADELARRLEAGQPLPGRRCTLAIAAGFGRVDPLRLDLLRAALATADDGRLYVPAADSRLSRYFLATWGADDPETPGTDPLAETRRLERAFGAAVEPAPVAPTLYERLHALGPGADLLAPGGPLELLPCGDPESESRVVCDRVAALIDAHGESPPRIAIAVNDPDLAERLFAQLTDAGLEVDSTHGRPLAVQAAGLLLRFVLRAALTGLRAEPLLEVLTHPYVRLGDREDDDGQHGRWSLQLEQMFRRDLGGPEGGLAGLHRRAEDRDQAALDLFGRQGEGMVGFVTAIADAFAPLLEFGGDGQGMRRAGWRELLDAVQECWDRLAPKHPLRTDAARTDVQKAAELMQDLRWQAPHLPAVTLPEFAADLGRLLAEGNVAANRRPHLPILLTGLVEARLERYDHLIVAGLREGVFPSRTRRPLLLPGRMRRRLGLPVWQEDQARDAELFLRLLHAAPRVLLTWPIDDQGQPALPSPLVTRLLLALGARPQPAAAAPLWRRQEIPWNALAADQAAFATETLDVPLTATARERDELSWSALRLWRDCPYRFLLERGFALRKPEEVRAEFGRKEYGRLVHDVLKEWLTPQGEGWGALAAGDAARAETLLCEGAAAAFLPGSRELPVRKLWFDTFQELAPRLVRAEIERFAAWRPIALERRFRLPIGALIDWIAQQSAALGIAPELPDAVPTDLLLTGGIDRVDRSETGDARLAVLDYKTGKMPTAKSIATHEELQVVLYAAALEAGALAGDPESPEPPVRGEVAAALYYPLEGDEAGPPPKPHVDCADAEGRQLLVEGAAEVVRLACAAADPQAIHPLLPRARRGEGPAGLPCQWCDFRGVCRIEERGDLDAATRRRLDKLIGAKEGFGT